MSKSVRSGKQRYLIISGVICAAILSLGNFDNPPNGFTGAPGESLCTECHSLGTATQNGSIIFSGFPSTINANQTYTLTITVVNPNGVAEYAGFQTVILDENEENAGTLSNPSAGSVITQFGDRTYHEHSPAQEFPAANAVAWTVNWTAPAGSGQISYYAAANIANGNNNDSGDRIVTKTGSGTLFTPVQLQITDITHVSCFDGSDGSIMASASFGNPGYTYAWSNGASGQLIVGLSAGNYTVTVTDAQGATATASAQVNEPPLFEITSETVDHISCNGENDGTIILELDGGVPPYSGAQGNFITYANLPPGEFIVEITDANGCLIEEAYFINEPAELTVDMETVIEPDCFGEASGFITVEGSGGVGTYEFIWSNGGTMNLIQNIASGIYSVTITDENGCTAARTFILDEPEMLELDLIASTTVSCNGLADGALTVAGNGGTGDLEFTWSNGAVSNTISGLIAGNYSVTVTDENGCTHVATYGVSEPEPLAVDFMGMLSLACFDDDDGSIIAQPSGGTASYAFLWANGSTSEEQEGLLAGIYDVTVTDANGCTLVASAEITEPPPLIPNVTATGESAVGAMDGTATASPEGGTGDYHFLWNTGDTTAMITGLTAGVYSLTVTDGNGCIATQSVAVSGISCAMQISAVSFPALCHGSNDGTAEVLISGAAGTVDILWSTGDTTEFIENLAAGMYTVTVVDSLNCLALADVQVLQPAAILTTLVVMDETMEGANDGSIMCNVSGGTSPYDFTWSSGDTTQHVMNLAPGTYSVTIVDANGCTDIDSAFVDGFICGLQATLSADHVECFGDSTGTASLVISGGASPYKIIWSTGDTTTIVDSLSAGMYQVSIEDDNGCVITEAVEIIEPEPVFAAVDSVLHASPGQGGAIFISVSGGTGPYTFIWTRNGGLISTEEDPEDLAAGEYVLLIIDANGCEYQAGIVTVMFTSSTADQSGENAIVIWPNPVRDILHVSSSSAMREAKVQIYSGSGLIAVDYNAVINDDVIQIDIHNFSEGMYFLIITDESVTKVLPFIKL